MKKHLREIIHHIKDMAPGAKVEPLPVKGHAQLRVAVDGVSKRFTISNTPARAEITVRNAVKDVARSFNLNPTIRL